MSLTASDLIRLDITEEDIRESVKEAVDTHYVDNLRCRNEAVRFDTAVRGKLSERGVRNFLGKSGIFCCSSGRMEEDHADVDLSVSLKDGTWSSLEVKSSLCPDSCRSWKDIIRKTDIKIPVCTGDFQKDIKRDVYVQTFYGIYKGFREDFLRCFQFRDGLPKDVDRLYDLLEMDMYLGRLYLVGWTTAEREKAYLVSEKEKTWGFSNSVKSLWKSPLSQALPPEELPVFLKNLKKQVK